MSDAETWVATVALGWIETADHGTTLHQMHVSTLGNIKWVPVPTVKESRVIHKYGPCIADATGEDDGEDTNTAG